MTLLQSENSCEIKAFKSVFKTSAKITLTLSKPESVLLRTGFNLSSISIATTFFAASQRQQVKTPAPGPISIIPVSLSAALCAILGHTDGSVIKFCPKDFLNVNPSVSRILLSSVSLFCRINFSQKFNI